MKILHILGSLKLSPDPDHKATSGVVRVALELAREQVRLGHDVTVATVDSSPWRSLWHGVKLVGLAYAPWAKLHVGKRKLDFSVHMPYVLLTRRQGFDIVQGHLYNYLRFLTAKSTIIHMHADPCHQGHGTESAALRPADIKMIADYSTHQVGVSHFIARQLKNLLKDRGDIRVIHNGVDASRFEPATYKQSRCALRRRWGVKENEPVVLFAGAIAPEKGVMHLARAFSALLDHAPEAHLVIAGGSGLWGSNLHASQPQSDYERQVERELHDSRTNVHLLGKVDYQQMPEIYAACDMLVLPSTCQEAFPLSVLEAMAAGLPVIASRVGGIPEMVNEENGILLDQGDEAALRGAMLELSRNKARRQGMGRAGKATAQNFSWSQVALKFEALYSDAQTLQS